MIDLKRPIESISKEELILALYRADDAVNIAHKESEIYKRNESLAKTLHYDKGFNRGFWVGLISATFGSVIALIFIINFVVENIR